jgi:hypothetical protein
MQYAVTLVHPVFEEKIFRTKKGNEESIRKSPKKENLLAMFNELIFIPELFQFPNFTLEIVLIKTEIIRKIIRRNRYKIIDKKLLEINKKFSFNSPSDFLYILPYDLQKRLSTKNLMARLQINYRLASKIIYFFKKLELLKIIQKEGNLKIYSVKNDK